MGWNEARKQTEGAGGSGGDFLKINDGETVVVAIRGEPEIYLAKPFNEGDAPKQRVLLNVFNVAQKKLGILDLSAGVFQQLCEIRDKFDFERFLVSIKRKGTAKNTRYTILPDKELSEQQKAYLAKVEFPNLGDLAERIRFKSQDETVSRPSYPRPDAQPQQSMAAAMGVTDENTPF